jgi:20S proteasome subunit alpha 7
VVLALEKLVTSKLLKPGANKRIASVDRNMGIVSTTRGSMDESADQAL